MNTRPEPSDVERRLAALSARRPTQGAQRSVHVVSRRAKPARNSKIAALIISVSTTAGLAVSFAKTTPATDTALLTSGTLPTQDAPSMTGVSSSATTPSVAANATAEASAPAVSDGTYVGAASQNRWGVVQVQAVYQGGQLSDVQVLRYPDGERKSVAINQYSLPILISDSLSIQSAEVNGVSGATYTSRSYVQSLQSAIDAAKTSSNVS